MSVILSKRRRLFENDLFESYDNSCTVLMSSYNGEKYVGEQIESILNQKQVRIHLFVRDDGSTDDTINIIERYQSRYGNIHLIRGENVGIHDSFRMLIEACEGSSFIAFSDQDDIWDYDKIITAIQIMKEYKAHFYSSAARLVDQYNQPLNISTSCASKYDYYMNGNSIVLTPGAQGCTMVLTSNLYNYLRGLAIPSDYGHDTWIPIISYYLCPCIYDSEERMNYRQHNNSWTGNRKKKINHYFKEAVFFWKGMKRYSPLAKVVYSEIHPFLEERDCSILKSLFEHCGFVSKLKIINRYHLGKYGFFENILFKIYYLLVIK